MIGRERGFSLAEILVALGISGIVLVSVMTIFNASINDSIKSERSNEAWIEAIQGSGDFSQMLSGVARIEPPEDLLANGDGLFTGVTNLPAGATPTECRNTPDFNVLRVTSFANRQRAERLLRLWSTASANQTAAADELRLTFDAGSAFARANGTPSELYLVDADGNWRRRFLVKSFQVRTTNLDPYDDTAKMDAAGKPISFTYVSVLLAKPTMPDGSESSVPDLNFLTNSIAIPVKTNVICLNKAGQAVKLSETGGVGVQQLMKLTDGTIRPVKMTFEFANTTASGRIDNLIFYSDLIANASRACMSLLRFRIEANPSAHLSRSVLLTNYLPLRPISCP